jgi:L-methionine (R)-S-oxide reductase
VGYLDYDRILQSVTHSYGTAPSAEQMMLHIVNELSRIPHYDWIGFYMISAADPNILELASYVGAETPHKRIPLDQGICGAAASSGETVVVDDVNSDPRYLACSLETRSEIVAPVFAKGKVVGELDIDSHTPAAFSHADKVLVERCAALLGAYLEQHP